jgi:lipopolysaccharide export system permease protein
MGILGRYILKELLKALFPLWIFLGVLLYLFETMSGALSLKEEFGVVASLYLYKIPKNLELMFPVAALFSVLTVLGAMNRGHEIVAAKSLGVKNSALLKPLLFATLFGSVFHYMVTDTWAPWGMKEYWEKWDLQIRGRQNVRTARIKRSKIWFRNQEVLYHVGFWDPRAQEIYDLSIYTFDSDFHVAQIIEARKAIWAKDRWIMKNGQVRLVDKKLMYPITRPFEERETKLLDPPDDLHIFNFKVDILGQEPLGELIDRSRRLGIPTAKWETLYHSRISFLLVALIFILLAFPRVTLFHRAKGAAGDILFVGGVCFSYWVIFHYGLSLGEYGRLPPILAAWLPNILALAFTYAYSRYHTLERSSD